MPDNDLLITFDLPTDPGVMGQTCLASCWKCFGQASPWETLSVQVIPRSNWCGKKL